MISIRSVCLAASAVLGLSGCAQLPRFGAAAVAAAAAAPAAASGPAGAASGARPAVAPPVPGQPQPFATVIKDAKKIDGLITTWQKDEKFWFELRPEDFDKPLLFAPKLAQGIGEAGLFGGSMAGGWARQQVVEFHRVHNQVQLRVRNLQFTAPAGTPEGRAVAAGFAPSLMGSVAVASQPHPERKSVLVEANPLFLSDLLGIATTLQRAYRQGYGLDRGNSAITQVRGRPEQVVVEVMAHYATASLGQAQPGSPAPPPSVPLALPDARSMFMGLQYSLAALPATPMVPRRADARVGYFTSNVNDFGNDLARSPRQRFVNRWRLEKKDPAAALSEPVKPITFWLDRTIPLKYRDAITRGVLAWNPAFEKIGFKDAVVVKLQPDDADFDTLDVGVASIRWMTNATPLYGAIGPSQVDPRTGEILDADIGFESLSSRGLRTIRSQVLASRVSVDWPALMQSGSEERLAQLMASRAGGGLDAECQHAEYAAEQLGYALDVLEARGEIDPGSAEAEQFVQDYLMDTTMHEVGHTLGLRHNFRSSRIYSDQQLADPAFVKSRGLAGSVMEYAPINLAAPGEAPRAAWQLALGPYDYWAIEYAYKPLAPGSSPADEEAELQRIAGRSAEPELAYGTDEDNSLGVDPESLHFDLGSDPVAFGKKRIAIARELIQRQASRTLKPNEDYSVLRRSVSYALRELGRAGGILARQIGGLRTLRDYPGTGRDPLQPVPAPVQRDALDALSSGLLAVDSVVLPPVLQRRLAPDFQERTDALFGGEGAVATDYSAASVLLDLQRALLGQLMSDGLASRILDSEGKVTNRADAFHLSELYDRLLRDVWSELDGRGDIAAPRRELQRSHATLLAAALLRPSGQGRADARSLLRQQAGDLLERLAGAERHRGLSAEARAHLRDASDTLKQALAARMNRSG